MYDKTSAPYKKLKRTKIMPIWPVASPEIEPCKQLLNWQIVEVTHPSGEVSRHILGVDHTTGRVSSKIISCSWESGAPLSVVTESGRLYILSGHPGQSNDAVYVLRRWLFAHQFSNLKIVTDEYHQGSNKGPAIRH